MLQNETHSNTGSRVERAANDNYRVRDGDSLRYKDEFLRLQLLYMIGQLYLIKCCLLGENIDHQASYKMNTRLLHTLLHVDNGRELLPADRDLPRREAVAL